MTGFRLEPLGAHDRQVFDCGVAELDRYFREQVSQDMWRRLTNCFVAVDAQGAVAAYYTLAATSLPIGEIAEQQRKRLPRYPLLPACLIGRLAVATGFHRRGLGSAMIVDAIARAARADPAIFAILVDSKNEQAAAFYRHLGFLQFESAARKMYLPLGSALRLLQSQGLV